MTEYYPFFPEASPVNKPTGTPRYNPIDQISPERQGERLNDAILEFERDAVQKILDISQNPQNIDPELGWVLEICGNSKELQKVLQSIPGIDVPLINEMGSFPPDDDFHHLKKTASGKMEADPKKKVSFSLYLITFDTRASQNFVKIWKKWQNKSGIGDIDESLSEFTKFLKILPYIKDIHKWSVKDQLELDGFKEELENRLKDYPEEPVKFEIELIYSSNEATRRSRLSALNKRIRENNGRVLDGPCLIEEIGYQGVLVELPACNVTEVMNHPSVNIAGDGVLTFRMMGQSKPHFTAEIDVTSSFTPEEINSTISNIPLRKPVILMLDGYPLENHVLLQNRLDIDDSGDIDDLNYPLEERRHGTEMASLILHGHIGRSKSLNQKIRIVPVNRLKIIFTQGPEKYYDEVIPDDKLTVDFFHRILKEQLMGNRKKWNESGLLLINLSQGISGRPYFNCLSPLSRLLDWVSYKANVLFIISAGNHDDAFTDEDNNNTSSVSKDFGEEFLCHHLTGSLKNRLLSPSESINSITVGSLNWNGVGTPNDEIVSYPEEDVIHFPEIFPSITTSCGYGYGKSIKPDILYPGGKRGLEFYKISSIIEYQLTSGSNSEAGISVAYPSIIQGNIVGKEYDVGTSLSAALATHDAGLCYEQLITYFEDFHLPDKYYECLPVILKALLVHSSGWGITSNKIKELLTKYDENYQNSSGPKQKWRLLEIATRWMGYGRADASEVLTSNDGKVTLIGCGYLKGNPDLSTVRYEWSLPKLLYSHTNNRITVTLAYLSPINFKSLKNHQAKITFNFMSNVVEKRSESIHRIGPDYNTVQRGTVQHEIFENVDFQNLDVDKMCIDITCKYDGNLESRIPYGIIITIDNEQTDVESNTLYTQMREIIAPRVRVESEE